MKHPAICEYMRTLKNTQEHSRTLESICECQSFYLFHYTRIFLHHHAAVSVAAAVAAVVTASVVFFIHIFTRNALTHVTFVDKLLDV